MVRQTPHGPGEHRNEEFWREFLANPDPVQGFGRGILSRLPADPRCQLCASPFRGPGGAVFRILGKSQSANNPRMCTSCEKVLLRYRGGAEVDASLLFADIRGSTALAEQMAPTSFRDLLDRFYTVASETVFDHGGIVDKFVGDELVAAFPPLLGERHAERAVAAARDLLRATGHADPGGPWVPVGAGVHTGRMWFGTIGDGNHVEITTVGDVVNTTARLASQAGAGEILVSVPAGTAAGLDPQLERRSLSLKGKGEPVEVVSLAVE